MKRRVKSSTEKTIRGDIALSIFWIGVFLALYVSGWIVIGASIASMVSTFSAGVGTFWTVILTILKCFGGIIVGCAIVLLGYVLAALIS